MKRWKTISTESLDIAIHSANYKIVTILSGSRVIALEGIN